MKFLSLVILTGLLTVSCAHKKSCGSKDHCDKKQEKSCCKEKKEGCKDSQCAKKDAPKAEEKKQ